ncbi:transposable element Tc1 transposase [Trichonephila clavipes]|nr:transposable element Tc1 transposase [Trichonephila clavipes]
MRIWEQWTDEHRTTRNTSCGRRKVTSAHNDRHLLCIAVNDHTASSRQLAARWSTATGVLMLTSSIRRSLMHRGVRARVLLYKILLTTNHRWPRLHWQDNAHPNVAKTVRDFCSAQHMQRLPWPAYSPDMSPIEHVWDLVGRRFARDLRPAASKDNCCAYKQYEILLHK